MRAITKFLAGGAAIVALSSAAPAAAQYYPGYPGYPGYGMPGADDDDYGYNNPYGYGVNSQAAVNQCANAVQARLSGGYGGGYGGYGGYGYNGYGGYGGGRVLGISRVEQRAEGGLTVRGVATSGYSAYGYAPNTPDLVWKCRTDFRGVVISVDVDRAQRNYGYQYTPWNNDYSQYGYRRY